MTPFEKWSLALSGISALGIVFWIGYGWGILKGLRRDMDRVLEYMFPKPAAPPPANAQAVVQTSTGSARSVDVYETRGVPHS